MIKKIIFVFSLLFIPAAILIADHTIAPKHHGVVSHSGGTDKCGCHNVARSWHGWANLCRRTPRIALVTSVPNDIEEHAEMAQDVVLHTTIKDPKTGF